MALVQVKEFPGFRIEVLSVGKNHANPSLNEDRWVVQRSTFAVIDGATSRIPMQFAGKSGGQFVAEVVKEVLETTDPEINGKDLVDLITNRLNARLTEIGAKDIISQTPEARPAALFAAARIVQNKLIITAVGDVGCRVNDSILLLDHLKIDEVVITKRVRAMKQAQEQNPEISDQDLMEIGKKAIEEDLKEQTRSYYNNPDTELGHGIIDGRVVPEKFIQVHKFNLGTVKTLEIFSDGYFKLGDVPEIDSWEEAFRIVEQEDPLKWKKYLGVKGSNPEQLTDDRTILIAHAI